MHLQLYEPISCLHFLISQFYTQIIHYVLAAVTPLGNPKSRVVTICTAFFNVPNSPLLTNTQTHKHISCFVILITESINRSVFVMGLQYVFLAVPSPNICHYSYKLKF